MRLLVFALLLSFLIPSPAQEAPPPEPPSAAPEQVEALIRELEDPAARERLIEQLRLLTQVRATPEEAAAGAPAADVPASEVQSATTELLSAVSDELRGFAGDVVLLVDRMNEFAYIEAWLRGQIMDPMARALWIEVLANLALILGIGYLAFYGLHLSLIRPHKALAGRTSPDPLARVLLLLVNFVLDFLPIVAFAIGAYLTLTLVDPQTKTRLVALAWINAAIIVRAFLALGRMIFAPATPNLRLLPVSDETAHYADIWIRRLSFTAVYGYFALQAALLLGLPWLAYQALLRLLGFVVALLVLVLVLQNRAAVAHYIRGPQDEAGAKKVRFRAVRRRLAQVWFLLAMVYVLVLYAIWALEVTGGFLFLLQATALTLAILVLGHLALRALAALFTRGFRVSRELRERFPGLEARANRYIPVIQTGCRWLIYAAMVLGILQAWNVNTFGWLMSDAGQVLIEAAVTVLATVVVSVAIWEVVSSTIESYLAETDRFGRTRVRSARARTLLTVARNALFVLLLVVSTLLILAEIGVNITPLLAGAGVLGVAIGFGSQKLVQDVITGVFILFEDLISVGDVVNVGDKGGLVEAVSIRNVRLRDLSGTVHTIPYSAITTVSNLTKDFSYYVFDVAIAYREDVDHVMEVLKEIGATLQQDLQFRRLIIAPLEILGVDAFADSAVIVKARIKTLPIQQWTVGREFNRRMKKRFDELGIEIPFPHQTVYFGEDRKGEAPPLRVQVGPGMAAETVPLARLQGTAAPAYEQAGGRSSS